MSVIIQGTWNGVYYLPNAHYRVCLCTSPISNQLRFSRKFAPRRLFIYLDSTRNTQPISLYIPSNPPKGTIRGKIAEEIIKSHVTTATSCLAQA